MEPAQLFLPVIIGICIFIVSIYFIRWVFGIDKIIDLQREQTKLIRKISENMQEWIYNEDKKNYNGKN